LNINVTPKHYQACMVSSHSYLPLVELPFFIAALLHHEQVFGHD
jgi:hypothetical protein